MYMSGALCDKIPRLSASSTSLLRYFLENLSYPWRQSCRQGQSSDGLELEGG